jgi:Protein of unknown function (DUF732)
MSDTPPRNGEEPRTPRDSDSGPGTDPGPHSDSGPAASVWVSADQVIEKASRKAASWRVLGAGGLAVAVVAGVVGLVVWPSGGEGGRGGAASVASASVPATASSPRPSSPADGPPYAAVPVFSSDAARDTAFVGDVGQFSTWPSGTVSYGVMSSMPGGGDVSDFRKAVVKDARAVCDALAGGVDMEDVPYAADVALDDPIEQAAFIVEAVTFYCPARTGVVTGGVYTEPVPVEQDEDCPDSDVLEMSVSIGERSDDEFLHSAAYTVKVRNTASYAVRAQLQQRWFAGGGYSGSGEWEAFGDVADDPLVILDAGETFTYEGEQNGIYHWDRTEVRVQPGEFVFFGCGYQSGPGPGPGSEEGSETGDDF